MRPSVDFGNLDGSFAMVSMICQLSSTLASAMSVCWFNCMSIYHLSTISGYTLLSVCGIFCGEHRTTAVHQYILHVCCGLGWGGWGGCTKHSRDGSQQPVCTGVQQQMSLQPDLVLECSYPTASLWVLLHNHKWRCSALPSCNLYCC